MVAPIKGMFARRLYKDIAISLTSGTIGGYWFWYQVHIPMSAYIQREMKKRDNFYAKLEAERA
ncbi:hypothetical protein CC85DRAFT_305446 [Cutaneotrichosporon oleaginosum]|uniref:Cytochrome c oxidase polypeptide VIIA n=1 Tax=Cutaneotrichosporon oleaginosum TaxID=879819 RepID=A0A0J0XD82_9TREE|nr:uncharacterized protein CC85DRAFT_305446 [Cutaneotrichosporon oleaginosum]KLT39003.1 hypothetical protein CC85DRAFT_305446 [Cutaneotrichosporon oleaginosum]TXT08310.1 hypothetical protein COLE_05234 [Cutaneotrichosporon oleaginosum]